MKKTYEAPELEMIKFQAVDIITASSTGDGTGALPGITPPGWG